MISNSKSLFKKEKKALMTSAAVISEVAAGERAGEICAVPYGVKVFEQLG